VPRDLILRAEQRDHLTVYPAVNLREFGADVFVTDRFNGVSAAPYDSLNLGDHVGDDPEHVRHNRALVARAAGVEADHLVTVHQVHGAHVLDADAVTAASEADALVTTNADLALAILVADCVPIALVDASGLRVAGVHAGWRGLRAGVIAAALEGFNPRSTRAFIGPCISRERYQVGPEVAQHFSNVDGALSPDGGDRSRLDLRFVATRKLLDARVPEEQIVRCSEVTDGGEIFFSDRAQRPCGRFALVARRLVA
jgi:YfiH family protein